jgi:hypothetical protein
MHERLLAVWVTASMSVPAGGCVMAGRGLDDDIQIKLAPAATKKSDVKALFGNPQLVSTVAPNGDACVERWSYEGSSPARRLTVSFTANGRICWWGTSSDGPVAQTPRKSGERQGN